MRWDMGRAIRLNIPELSASGSFQIVVNPEASFISKGGPGRVFVPIGPNDGQPTHHNPRPFHHRGELDSFELYIHAPIHRR